MNRSKLLVVLGAALLLPTTASAGGDDFTYNDVGDLIGGSGQGAADATVYAPGMRFPMEEGPAYPNSQVWGHGGNSGPGGGQCDTENYSYPWWDNYCETRSWDMPLCPSGVGHQGQDIRPATCDDGVHWNVSSEAGTVTNVGSYSVYVTAADGTRFDYLHGSDNVVSSGQDLAKAERINRVSNEFGGTATTIHMHYNIKQDVAGLGFIFVSPYMSLVTSYQELLGISTGGGVQGSVSEATCTAIVGWAQDGDDPEASIPVHLSFDGAAGDAEATTIEVEANVNRPELCEELGSCEHGFEVEIPRSLQDNASHDVFIYGVSGETSIEVESSPTSFQCAPPSVPSGVRRIVSGPEVVAVWGFSPFWDAASLDDAALNAIDTGEEFPSEPVLVRSDNPADDTVYLMDPGYKRRIPNAAVAEAWGLDLAVVAEWPANVLDGVQEGTSLREDVFLVQSLTGELWVIDDEQCPVDEPNCDDGGESGGSGTETQGESDSASGGGTGDESDGEDEQGGTGDTDSGGALPGAGENDGDGCGCTSSPARGSVFWLALPLLWLVRRRS